MNLIYTKKKYQNLKSFCDEQYKSAVRPLKVILSGFLLGQFGQRSWLEGIKDN